MAFSETDFCFALQPQNALYPHEIFSTNRENTVCLQAVDSSLIVHPINLINEQLELLQISGDTEKSRAQLFETLDIVDSYIVNTDFDPSTVKLLMSNVFRDGYPPTLIDPIGLRYAVKALVDERWFNAIFDEGNFNSVGAYVVLSVGVYDKMYNVIKSGICNKHKAFGQILDSYPRMQGPLELGGQPGMAQYLEFARDKNVDLEDQLVRLTGKLVDFCLSDNAFAIAFGIKKIALTFKDDFLFWEASCPEELTAQLQPKATPEGAVKYIDDKNLDPKILSESLARLSITMEVDPGNPGVTGLNRFPENQRNQLKLFYLLVKERGENLRREIEEHRYASARAETERERTARFRYWGTAPIAKSAAD